MDHQERTASAEQPILELYGISKAFPGVQALDNVSFTVAPGTVHALLGANGAGKSTLIKILAGAVARDDGQVIFDGKPASLSNPHEVSEMGISAIFQEPALVPNLTVEQNIFLGREQVNAFGWISTDMQRDRVLELLSDYAPHISPSSMVRNLRTSERQLIALAKAMLSNSKLIIMDEPSASMTAQETDLIFSAVGKVTRAGQSVIYITHRLDEVYKIANNVTVLRDGKHIITCPIDDLSRSDLFNLITGKEVVANERYRENDTETGRCLLEVQNLTRQPYYEDISFKVHAGEIVALTGLVGAGHAEVVRGIFGADPVDRGTIIYPKANGKIASPADVVRLGVVMIPEDRKAQGVVPKMTVGKNMMLSSIQRYVHPLSKLIKFKQVNQAIQKNIELLNIQPKGAEEKLLATLSGGNQQKVIIARGVESQAAVIIFDQPTAGVDVGAKSEIHKIIAGLANQGKGVLIISLEVDEVLAVADRILVIRDGRLVQELDGINASSHDVIKLGLDKIIEERENGN